MIRTKVMGEKDIDESIKRLDSRKARTLLQRALNQSAQPSVKQMRTNADTNVGRDTGEGRKNIKKRNLKKAERNKLGLDQAVMVYLAADGFYLGIWEFGFVRNGRHYPAKPWMRPAIDSTQGDVIRRYGRRAGELIEKEAAKR